MEKGYLPIGSVVLLKNAQKRVMITGFYVKQDVNSNEYYDYVGVMYPEGVIQSDKNLVFNNDQIDRVFFYGFIDAEEQEFKRKLYSLIEQDLSNKKEEQPVEETPEEVVETPKVEDIQPEEIINEPDEYQEEQPMEEMVEFGDEAPEDIQPEERVDDNEYSVEQPLEEMPNEMVELHEEVPEESNSEDIAMNDIESLPTIDSLI